LTRFPLKKERSYTPPTAPLPAYRHLLDSLGLERGVLVQPSVFGTDNRCLLDALEGSPDKLRGVAVVDADISDAELDQLSAAGVVGLRLNVLFRGGVSLDQIEALAQRIAPRGWHLQFLLDARDLPDLAPRLHRLPVDIVIDHMGHMPVSSGVNHPGFRGLLKLVESGRCWVKLSGANRISVNGPPYNDTTPFAHALIAANPERMVWGSDWPHVAIEGYMANDGDLLSLLADWAPDEATRRLILRDNPARLYRFPI
jgi:predicted TIM-barrel fold metal-dependent hydrolase